MSLFTPCYHTQPFNIWSLMRLHLFQPTVDTCAQNLLISFNLTWRSAVTQCIPNFVSLTLNLFTIPNWCLSQGLLDFSYYQCTYNYGCDIGWNTNDLTLADIKHSIQIHKILVKLTSIPIVKLSYNRLLNFIVFWDVVVYCVSSNQHVGRQPKYK